VTDFAKTRALFTLPTGVIYLDGNSLGPLPVAAAAAVAHTLSVEWGEGLIRSWNQAGWMDWPTATGDRIARLIGAPAGSVVVGDTLSIKVYQALAAALALRPDRRIILSDSGNFPTDLYMAEGLIRTLADHHELKIVAPDDVASSIDDSVAVLMLTEVDYRTGRLHDMAALTAQAHAAGAVTMWDLAHSAGALPVDVAAAGADFAVGCTYKYLNGGPGAPAFIYVAPRHAQAALPALSGWMGHAAPFAFETCYQPDAGIARMRVGTPPIVALAALNAALDIWDQVDMADIRRESIMLSELFIKAVEERCPQLTLASPRNPAQRGSQVSFRHTHGYAIMQAMIARGVIGDFRAPDIMRFGFTPLYTTAAEIRGAVDVLAEVVGRSLWDQPHYQSRAPVT
jgi:kynureninase